MNVIKKIFALLLAIAILSTVTIPAFASDESNSNSTQYSQFGYTVYDRYGNVKETGITPDFNTRYTWSGITLDNGEAAYFYPTHQNYFFIYENTKVKFELVLASYSNMARRLL